ncbi:Arc family DNA-binding protein [Pseudomonas syringae]|uniref:Arc family DNA-binding protein n=1 Tax=Pseudomonas syringae TaxID=317 RepID=UPI00246185F0|nr:Arc family DNA-binding protein [Pseudomonas syringae]MDH4602359.1 Arc family DNA-binding protein [Pseudomonas syringae pv. papulans]
MTERTALQTDKAREADKFVVRLPQGMRDRIHALAKLNRRSMNSEIVLRVHNSLLEDEVSGDGLTERQAQSTLIKALTLRLFLLERHCQHMPSDPKSAAFADWKEKLKNLQSSPK